MITVPGKTGYFAKGVNDAAGPPLYNMGIIVALIVSAVSVIGFSLADRAARARRVVLL